MNNKFDIIKDLILNIKKLSNNIKLFEKSYSTEYNNPYSIEIFDNLIYENFNILINIKNLIKNKKNFIFLDNNIKKIKNYNNIIIIIIHTNYLFLYKSTDKLNYYDYIQLFKENNFLNIINIESDDHEKNIKFFKLLNNNYILSKQSINNIDLFNEDIICGSYNLINETIDNINNIIKIIYLNIKNLDIIDSFEKSDFTEISKNIIKIHKNKFNISNKLNKSNKLNISNTSNTSNISNKSNNLIKSNKLIKSSKSNKLIKSNKSSKLIKLIKLIKSKKFNIFYIFIFINLYILIIILIKKYIIINNDKLFKL
jgi:hypothetical protein